MRTISMRTISTLVAVAILGVTLAHPVYGQTEAALCWAHTQVPNRGGHPVDTVLVSDIFSVTRLPPNDPRGQPAADSLTARRDLREQMLKALQQAGITGIVGFVSNCVSGSRARIDAFAKGYEVGTRRAAYETTHLYARMRLPRNWHLADFSRVTVRTEMPRRSSPATPGPGLVVTDPAVSARERAQRERAAALASMRARQKTLAMEAERLARIPLYEAEAKRIAEIERQKRRQRGRRQ